MIDRASDLRAIADGRLMLNVRNGVTVSRSMLARIADEFETMSAALAAKDAELEKVKAECDKWREAFGEMHRQTMRAEAALASERAALAEARKALDQIERKICAAEHGHTINDVLANYREVRRTVQDARAARRAREQGGE